jgi:hypothetical protein
LSAYGIGFPACNYKLGPYHATFFAVADQAARIPFVFLARDCQAMIESPLDSIELPLLDRAIATVRYYLSVMRRTNDEVISDLATAAFDALSKSSYVSDEGLCPDLLHGVLMVLVTELTQKLPAKYFVGQKYSQPFPGEVGAQERVADIVSLSLKIGGWHTTGFYLPAGELGHAKVASGEMPPGAVIQIGSHLDNLVQKPGPWQRWPSVVLSFDFDTEELDFASPFGGVVYLVSPAGGKVDLELSGVVKYPVFAKGSWNGTEGLAAPFAEIMSDYAILTLPVSILPPTDVIEAGCTFLDDLIDAAVHFTGDDSDTVYRVIFDMELATDSPVCGNPIVLTNEQLDAVFTAREPSPDLFCLLMFIAILSLPVGGFSEDEETCIGAVAAGVAFRKKWPNATPMDYSPDELPEQTAALWDISCSPPGEKAIPRSLQVVRSRPVPQGTTMWEVFIHTLGKINGISTERFGSRPKPRRGPAENVLPKASPNLGEFALAEITVAKYKPFYND